jgi:hypothetical protein
VFGFPTIYTICPSRVIATHGYVADVAFMWDQCATCMHQYADTPHDATLVEGYNDMTCKDPSTPLSITLLNVGTAPLTSATIEVVSCYDSTVVSTGIWSGSLGTYEEAIAELPAWEDAPPGGQCVFYRLLTPDDDAANSVSANQYFYAQSPGPSGTEVTIEILTDDHGDHLAWRLADAFGAVVDRRDAGEMENNTPYSFTYTLGADTCWWFIISNDATDGIASPGYYRLHSYGETFITPSETWQTANPGSLFVDQAYFHTSNGVGMNENAHGAPALFPNPADDQITLSTVDVGTFITMHDATGRFVLGSKAVSPSLVLDVTDLRPGIYSVGFSQQKRRAMTTLVIAR